VNRITLDREQGVTFGLRGKHENTAMHADDIDMIAVELA
jgi:uncharacterized protein YkuJ